ncbi:unnamed protein product, partial [Nesidiocoris tenuis]
MQTLYYTCMCNTPLFQCPCQSASLTFSYRPNRRMATPPVKSSHCLRLFGSMAAFINANSNSAWQFYYLPGFLLGFITYITSTIFEADLFSEKTS